MVIAITIDLRRAARDLPRLCLAAAFLVAIYLFVTRWPAVEEAAAKEDYAGPVYKGGREMPLFYVKTGEKKVAFTFDISWGSKTAPLVMDILKQHNLKATFFLSGFWAKKHPELVKRIVEDGHEIASHGDEHVNLSQYSPADIAANLATAHRDLKEATGVEPRYFRPPNGDYDDDVVRVARELNYETVIWSLDSLDWKNPEADYMIDLVVREAYPGDIILMHASDSSQQIHLALPGIIKGLRERGFEILNLSQLLAAGRPGRDDPRGRPREERDTREIRQPAAVNPEDLISRPPRTPRLNRN